jgi:hypothetical protein
VKEYYEVVNIVYLHDLKVYGSIEKLGAYASIVKYKINNKEYEELVENNDFAIIDEIVFHHVEEQE